MVSFFVVGGNKINGEISIGGAKNAVLPILAACVLVDGETVIKNVPNISDVRVAIDILKSLGFKVLHEKNAITVSGEITNNVISKLYSSKMRSSITFLGAILGRVGEGTCYFPGGCKLGERPIELHKKGFLSMGIEITEDDDKLICIGKPSSSNINLTFPSVGATQNIVLASVYAEGVTRITNAAKEPEIVDMVNFLNACGAKIEGAGTETIIIRGVTKLKGIEYKVMPDRIIAGTYLAAAAITNGELVLKDVSVKDMQPITLQYKKMGIDIVTSKNMLIIDASEPLVSVNIKTGTHPEFPTDMQAQTMAVLSQANGTSQIEENIFEARDKHVNELVKMGANITSILDARHFFISGSTPLKAATVDALDLRGGAALVLAALVAEGESRIKGAEYIERGYENIARDLQILGADIYRMEDCVGS